MQGSRGGDEKKRTESNEDEEEEENEGRGKDGNVKKRKGKSRQEIDAVSNGYLWGELGGLDRRGPCPFRGGCTLFFIERSSPVLPSSVLPSFLPSSFCLLLALFCRVPGYGCAVEALLPQGRRTSTGCCPICAETKPPDQKSKWIWVKLFPACLKQDLNC